MPILNLRPLGFNFEVELCGRIERQWAGGAGVVFVFGESHDDQDMIRDNLIDSCALIRTGIVKCAGVEDPIHAQNARTPTQLTLAQNEEKSLELFRKHRTDDGVIASLRAPSSFRFGRTLSFLRPHLPVRCVEDPDLHDKVCRIHSRFDEILSRTHNQRIRDKFDKRWPNLPSQCEREKRFVENLFHFWAAVGNKTGAAAILNTGSAHSQRCADRIREAGTSFIHVSQPRAANSYK
jgi:hypothetical protein